MRSCRHLSLEGSLEYLGPYCPLGILSRKRAVTGLHRAGWPLQILGGQGISLALCRAVHPMRRVAVTGLGVVAPNGVGKDAFWNACVEGHSGVGPITSFDASNHPTKIAAEVKDLDLMEAVPRNTAKACASWAAPPVLAWSQLIWQ